MVLPITYDGPGESGVDMLLETLIARLGVDGDIILIVFQIGQVCVCVCVGGGGWMKRNGSSSVRLVGTKYYDMHSVDHLSNIFFLLSVLILENLEFI